MGHLKKAAGGHLLKGDGGHLVNMCASDEPCTDCADDEMSATASVSGSCSGSECPDAAGTYDSGYPFKDGADYCSWGAGNAESVSLYVLWDKNNESFWGVAYRSHGGWGNYIMFGGARRILGMGVDTALFRNITDDVACIGGNLVGTFSLNGLVSGGNNCTGCTMDVTLT